MKKSTLDRSSGPKKAFLQTNSSAVLHSTQLRKPRPKVVFKASKAQLPSPAMRISDELRMRISRMNMATMATWRALLGSW